MFDHIWELKTKKLEIIKKSRATSGPTCTTVGF